MTSPDSDVLIVGAGPAGLSLAIALSQAGFTATVVEQLPAITLADPAPDGREIALTHPSRATLQRLGSWNALAPHEVGEIHEAQVHDGPLGQHGALQLNAGNAGVGTTPAAAAPGPLGFIVPNHALRRSAFAVAQRMPGVRILTGAQVTRVSTHGPLAALDYMAEGQTSPQRLHAPLLVAADSRFSATRRQLGLGAQTTDFGRTVIVCRMRHAQPHGNVAHECFGYERTLAVLPLPDDPKHGHALCSVVVTAGAADAAAMMALDPAAFAAQVQAQFATPTRWWPCTPTNLPPTAAPCWAMPPSACTRSRRMATTWGWRGWSGWWRPWWPRASKGRTLARPTCWPPTPAPTTATLGPSTREPTPSCGCTPTPAPCPACCASWCCRARAACRRCRRPSWGSSRASRLLGRVGHRGLRRCAEWARD